MKKVLFLIILSLFFIPNIYAKDVSSYINVNSITIYKDGIPVDMDLGDDPANYTRGVWLGNRFGFDFSWEVNMPANQTLYEGDTATLFFNIENVDWEETTEVPIISGGEEIGKFKKVNNTLVMTFNSLANNHTSVTGTARVSGQLVRRGAHPNDVVRTFTVGSKTVKYLFHKHELVVLSNAHALKQVSNTTNSNVEWQISIGIVPEKYLTDPAQETNRQNPSWVENNMKYKNFYVEDTMDNITDVELIKIDAMIYVPMSETNPTSSNLDARHISIMNAFTKLTPNPNETLDAFRARIKTRKLQYGIYRLEDKKAVFMIYFGDYPSPDLKYKDFDIDNLMASYVNPWWSDQRKQLWLNAHNESNVLNGMITAIAINVLAKYEPVTQNTRKTNTASIFYGDNTRKNVSATATLTPINVNVENQTPATPIPTTPTTGGEVLGESVDINNPDTGENIMLLIGLQLLIIINLLVVRKIKLS